MGRLGGGQGAAPRAEPHLEEVDAHGALSDLPGLARRFVLDAGVAGLNTRGDDVFLAAATPEDAARLARMVRAADGAAANPERRARP